MGDDTMIIVRFTADGLPAIEQALPLAQLPRKGADAAGLMEQAQAASADGKHDEARRIYAKAVTAFPDDTSLLNEYAWYLVTAPAAERRPAEAVPLARKAVALTQRKEWHILDTLAEALLLDGKPEEAQQVNDEAKVLAKDDDLDGLKDRAKRITEALAKKNAVP